MVNLKIQCNALNCSFRLTGRLKSVDVVMQGLIQGRSQCPNMVFSDYTCQDKETQDDGLSKYAKELEAPQIYLEERF